MAGLQQVQLPTLLHQWGIQLQSEEGEADCFQKTFPTQSKILGRSSISLRIFSIFVLLHARGEFGCSHQFKFKTSKLLQAFFFFFFSVVQQFVFCLPPCHGVWFVIWTFLCLSHNLQLEHSEGIIYAAVDAELCCAASMETSDNILLSGMTDMQFLIFPYVSHQKSLTMSDQRSIYLVPCL